MDVIHCPSCGSDDISKSSSSFEYGGSTRWSCRDCDWYYKKGSGIGTGTGNSGTHPRNAGPSGGQSTLTQTGSWCRNCENCVKGDHGCRPEEHIPDSEAVPVSDVVEALEEWHYDGMEALAESIKAGDVSLTPSFMGAIQPHVLNEESLRQELEDAIDRAIEQNDSKYFSSDDKAPANTVCEMVGAENDAERAFVKRELDQMWRDGRIQKSKFGYYND